MTQIGCGIGGGRCFIHLKVIEKQIVCYIMTSFAVKCQSINIWLGAGIVQLILLAKLMQKHEHNDKAHCDITVP
jgi:hypothetical protein